MTAAIASCAEKTSSMACSESLDALCPTNYFLYLSILCKFPDNTEMGRTTDLLEGRAAAVQR